MLHTETDAEAKESPSAIMIIKKTYVRTGRILMFHYIHASRSMDVMCSMFTYVSCDCIDT